MSTVTDTLWYTRCPVPTALGIAVQRGWIADEFAPDGIFVKSIQETSDAAVQESHFDHTLRSSFRQGGNIPAIWARARGRDTRVIGLSWTDEFQAILALPESGIHRARDLRDLRIGLPVNPISIDFNRASALRGFHAALGLDGLSLKNVDWVDALSRETPESGTRGIATGDGARRRLRHGYQAETLALLRGDVDAIYVKGALGLETARLIGARIISDLGSHPDPEVRVNNGTPRTLTVDAALIEERPDLVARFLARVVDAGNWARAHPDETVAYIARETGSTPDWVHAAYGDDAAQKLGTFLDPDSVDALSDFKDFLFAHGFLEADFDVADWVDPQPLEELARRTRDAA
ncbi:ABC transporter substrate-binding protein [Sphingosinicella sp. BN140058]|uniref:ABC transporter substrate-binding protein n=1 Tax=Sphingosinicella sp. BN140058 TaxID=1892855 RepID=UPI001012F66A|nr:ABC transporter substrate-binding protein [Sphingosinicella sp. BN140058]QAY76043.1 ABC transporter substrate-binding protein [Sphingosinicella sp. BN140058]